MTVIDFNKVEVGDSITANHEGKSVKFEVHGVDYKFGIVEVFKKIGNCTICGIPFEEVISVEKRQKND